MDCNQYDKDVFSLEPHSFSLYTNLAFFHYSHFLVLPILKHKLFIHIS